MQKIKTTIKQSLTNNLQFEVFDIGSKTLHTPKGQDEAKKLLDELGLSGQQNLVELCGDIVMPFTAMSTIEERVWKQYCPHRHKLEEYKDSIIPVEILKLLRTIKEKEYFSKEFCFNEEKRYGRIEIWSETSDDIDPLVVGLIPTDKYEWNDKIFLLARWGHSLRPFEEIKKIVTENMEKKAKLALEEGLATYKKEINEYLNGKWAKDSINFIHQ